MGFQPMRGLLTFKDDAAIHRFKFAARGIRAVESNRQLFKKTRSASLRTGVPGDPRDPKPGTARHGLEAHVTGEPFVVWHLNFRANGSS